MGCCVSACVLQFEGPLTFGSIFYPTMLSSPGARKLTCHGPTCEALTLPEVYFIADCFLLFAFFFKHLLGTDNSPSSLCRFGSTPHPIIELEVIKYDDCR